MFISSDPSGFNPTKATSATCKLWHNARLTPIGSISTSWLDLSGYGNNSTFGVGTITNTAAQQNGQPVVLFSGSPSLTASSGLYGLPNGANTAYVVAKRTAEGTNQALLYLGAGAATTRYALYYTSSTGILAFRNDNGSSSQLNNGGNPNTTYQIIKAQFNGSTGMSLGVNNKKPTTNSSGSLASDVARGNIANAPSILGSLNGGIAEIAWFNGVLSNAEDYAMKRYLAYWWGLSI